MMRFSMASAISALAMFAAGCAPEAKQAQAPEIQQVAPLMRAGDAQPLAPEGDTYVQAAASVVELDQLANQGDAAVKLFGTAGGDPAMNGLYTYLAFYEGAAEGWRIFKLGDFLSYRVLSESPGRADLEIQESIMDGASGEIGSRTRRVIVEWTMPGDGSPPTSVDVSPAE